MSRIAIVAACAPDTPAGHATVRGFAAAAERAGRVFIPVRLECEAREHLRRVNSLQRQCSYKNRCRAVDGAAAAARGNMTEESKSGGGDDGAGQQRRDDVLHVVERAEIIISKDGIKRQGGHGSADETAEEDGVQGRLADVQGTLTVDITTTPVFSTALQIVEWVDEIVAARDAEMCSLASAGQVPPQTQTQAQAQAQAMGARGGEAGGGMGRRAVVG